MNGCLRESGGKGLNYLQVNTELRQIQANVRSSVKTVNGCRKESS